MKKLTYLFTLIIITSCSKLILPEDEINSPKNNFNIFWNDFDQHYSLFTVRNINWNELYDQYEPQVSQTTSDEELWTILSNMIEHLDDGHTNLYDGSGRYYSSGSTLNEQAAKEINKELIVTKYLDFVSEVSSEGNLAYGKIKDKNIGYIYLGLMRGENPNVIDDIVNELKNYEAIIFDIRQNDGGDDRYAFRMARAFSNGEHFIYTVQTRNGVNHDDFDEKQKHYTQYDENNSYTKPVIVLTDRATISAGEIFLLNMKSFDHVVQVGDSTSGDFSVSSNVRFLPNSWHYDYSIQKLLLPNEESLDGIGHVPDVYIKNTEQDIESLNDKVIEKAIEYLFDTYQIE